MSEHTFEIKAAVDDLGLAFHQFKDANDRRLLELEQRQAADPLSDEKVTRLNTELDRLQGRMEKLSAASRRSPLAGTAELNDHSEQKAAFSAFVRTGDSSSLEAKALSVGSDADGGYAVPGYLYEQVLTLLAANAPVRQQATTLQVNSDQIDLLVDQGTAGSSWVAETGARNETTSPQLARVRIPVHEIYAAPRAAQMLLDDAVFDVESWLVGRIADSMAAAENAAFTSGDGNGKPKGFLSYAAGTTWGTIERVKTGFDGIWPSSTPADKLIELYLVLKSGYADGAVWMMNRTLLSDIRRFKTSDNAYLWQPGLGGETASTLLGYPVIINEDMPARASGSLSVAFGNFRRGYAVVDRTDLRILRDPFTSKPYVVFYATKRVGGDVSNFEAIKLLQFAV
jgi:HK97 family phage major capsid protein